MSKFEYTGQEDLEAMKVATNYNNYLRKIIINEAKEVENCKVLDFGAGIGTYADLMREKNFEVDCLEIDSDQVAQLRKKGYQVYNSMNKIKQQYDYIYAFNVFEHIENDIKIFKELSDLLVDGGKIIIYVPAFQFLYSSMDRLVGHHRRYRRADLGILADKAGLKIEKLQYCEPIGYFAAARVQYTGNDQGTISAKSVKIYDKYVFPFSAVVEPATRKFFGKNALLIATK